ncbi:hypothetical protein [Vampirovibrio chlorellavorus]|uniref:hypothetical protein n=1 Tax=Vampirovibrio chlorellavorus TaxID=758823 RepID=UPI0026ED38C7|nr:hypothetical protein [Vampirovibrio chlorellavorus]
MLKVQKLLLNLLALLLLSAALLLVFQNMDIPEQHVKFLGGTLIDLPLGALLAMVALMVGASILLKAWERTLDLGNQYKKINRDLERKDVSREEAESKVKVLENKVETLEKALTAAIKSQQSP